MNRSSEEAVAIGMGNVALTFCTAIGSSAWATPSPQSIAIGHSAVASWPESVKKTPLLDFTEQVWADDDDQASA